MKTDDNWDDSVFFMSKELLAYEKLYPIREVTDKQMFPDLLIYL